LIALFVELGVAGSVSQPLYIRFYGKNVLKNFSQKVKLASDEFFEQLKLD